LDDELPFSEWGRLCYQGENHHLVSQPLHPAPGKEMTAVLCVEVAQTCLHPSGGGYLLPACSWKTVLGQWAPRGESPKSIKSIAVAE